MKYYYKSKKGNKVLCLDHQMSEDIRYRHSSNAWTSATENEYNAYVSKQTAKREIADLKQKLATTDYVAIKIAEGEATKSEYATILATRKEQRARINELEKLVK